MSDEHKSAAELQIEIDAQRDRVNSTIDQIQDKLSPGQLVDELMAYGKSGGGEFVANLGHSISKNPIPVALIGVGIAWLIGRPSGSSDDAPRVADLNNRSYRAHNDRGVSDRDYNFRDRDYSATDREWDERLRSNGGVEYEDDYFDDEDEVEYPYASITGSSMQRLGHVTDSTGERYSEFVDDAGKKFRALSDEVGNRAGNYTDEAGNIFKGFTDEAGSKIDQFRDEAGNLLHEASGWASHTWRKVRRQVAKISGKLDGARHEAGARLHDARDTVQNRAGSVQSSLRHGASDLQHRAHDLTRGASGNASHLTGEIQHQADRVFNDVRRAIDQQPLVAGALAFAVGAAIAASLPRTRKEDELFGEAADDLKHQAGQQASELYHRGKEQVGTLYETATEKAGEIYEQAKDSVTTAAEQAKQTLASATQQVRDDAGDIVNQQGGNTAEANENRQY